MRTKLNVLLITTDQHRADCIGFAGRRVRTPHLDELAEGGTHFSSCITPNVVCQPSRASILTGLLPSTHGVIDNGYDLSEQVAESGFAAQLTRAGYSTAFIGKAHFSTNVTFTDTGTPECHLSQQRYGADWFGPYMGIQHVELCVEGHLWSPVPKPLMGQHYEQWFHSDGRGDERNRQQFTRMPPDTGYFQAWNSALPPAWHTSTWVGDRAIEFITRNRTEAFCIWASFPDPHVPFDCPAPWCFIHDPEEVDLPGDYTLDLDRRAWWHKASLTPPDAVFVEDGVEKENSGSSTGYSRIAPRSNATLRRIVSNYYGMISLIDHNIGRIVLTLKRLGLYDKTLLIFAADHGEWLGDHGLLQKGPILYDSLLRVPLLIRGPGILAGRSITDPVSTLDISSTICDFCGAGTAQPRHGKSLWPLIQGKETRDFAYHEWDLDPGRYGINEGLSLRTVRTRTHKLTVEMRSGAGELYDLVNDPEEMHDLFRDPSAVRIRKELYGLIRNQPNDRPAIAPRRVGIN